MHSGHSKTGLIEIVLETAILTHSTQLLTIMSQVNQPPIFKHCIANTSHAVVLPSLSPPFKLTLSKGSAGLRIPCPPTLSHDTALCSDALYVFCLQLTTLTISRTCLQQVTQPLTSDTKFDNSSRPIGPSDHARP